MVVMKRKSMKRVASSVKIRRPSFCFHPQKVIWLFGYLVIFLFSNPNANPNANANLNLNDNPNPNPNLNYSL